jgi:ribonuclease BN (tRNA processing enzyme)
MKIKVLGAHNTESLETRYMSLIVDDILALDAGGLTSGLLFQDQVKVQAVFITHAHYDHIRDIPAFAMNLFLREKTASLYTHQAACDNLLKYFLNGDLYPEFHRRPAESPTLKIQVIEALQEINFNGYKILPVPVTHALPAMGYQVTSPEGKTIFYTGDTGEGLSGLWEQIKPDVLFIELTAPNRWEESMKKNGHLTPNLLKQELINLRNIKGYLPRVIAVHLNPASEDEIKSEVRAVSEEIKTSIELAYEGMRVEL